MLYRTIIICLSLLLSACATRHAKIDDPRAATGCSEVLVRQIAYTPKGVPVFQEHLAERPSSAGERFTLVQITNSKPVKSYDIVVAGSDSDFSKPFKAVYEWTGMGFVGGAQLTVVTTDIASHHGRAGNREESAFTLAFAVAPIVIGTAGGFVIGVADGIRTTAVEMGKAANGNQEQVVAYTTYEYDALDRLAYTRMYKADDPKQEVVRTEYAYQVDYTAPVKTTITTFPDGAVRIIE